MASFEAQVHALTNIGATLSSDTTPTHLQLDQFLKDGVIDVTDKCLATSPGAAENFLRQSSEQTSNGFNPGTTKIITVLRENGTNNQWYPCKKSSMALEYKATDPDSLYFASKYNPVYMISQNRNVHVYPEPSSDGNDTFKVLYVNYDPEETDGTDLDHDSTGIKWFPDDKVYLVVIYAAIKCIETKMAAMHASIPTYSSTALASGDWAFIETTLESAEDIELGDARVKSLTAEMQQFVAEYQWYQGKVQSLRQEYFTAFDMNKPEPPQAEPQREGRRR